MNTEQCPKCGQMMNGPYYEDKGYNVGPMYRRAEALRYTCPCGYSIEKPTLDARSDG